MKALGNGSQFALKGTVKGVHSLAIKDFSKPCKFLEVEPNVRGAALYACCCDRLGFMPQYAKVRDYMATGHLPFMQKAVILGESEREAEAVEPHQNPDEAAPTAEEEFSSSTNFIKLSVFTSASFTLGIAMMVKAFSQFAGTLSTVSANGHHLSQH